MRPQDFEKSTRRSSDPAIGKIAPDTRMIMIPASAVRTAPAAALANTDAGPVLVLSPEVLLGKTARDIRLSGLVVPTNVPDNAEVVRDDTGRIVFRWVDLNGQ